MLQETARSIQQDHCLLWKRPRRIPAPPIARLALTLIVVLFIAGLSFAFVNQNNVAHAAEIQSMSQPATTVSGDSMMQKHAMARSAKYVTINGDVIVVVIKDVEVGKKLEIELEIHPH